MTNRITTTTPSRSPFPTFLVLLGSLLLANTPASAAAVAKPAAPVAAEETEAVEVAPVRIDGNTLLQVRGITSFPAEKRAVAIAARIEMFARDATLAPQAVQVVSGEGRSELVAGGNKLMTVLEADAGLEGVTHDVLAEIYRRYIEAAVTNYRMARTPQALLRSSGFALAAGVALVVVLWLLHAIYRRLLTQLERRFKARVRDLHIQSFRFLHAEQMWAGLQALLRLVYWLLLLAALFVGFEFILGLYPWTRGFSRELADIVLGPLAVMGHGLLAALPGIVFLIILFVITRYVLKTIRLFFDAVARGTVKLENFDADWAWPTYRIIRLLVVVLAVVVGYPYIPGSGSDAFKGISLFLGVIFSLGSSSIMANIMAGYTMTYRRTFRVGDRVKIGEHTGDVTEVRLMVTRLRTPKNEEVVIPNSQILNGDVVNYSALAGDQGLILHTVVGIGYETPWRQVEAMLLQAAARTAGLLQEPKPFVLQKALGDFAVTYEINVYCNDAQAMNLRYAQLHQNILDVFNEYGVQIMTPAYEGDPAQPKLVPKDQWYTAPAVAPVSEKR